MRNPLEELSENVSRVFIEEIHGIDDLTCKTEIETER